MLPASPPQISGNVLHNKSPTTFKIPFLNFRQKPRPKVKSATNNFRMQITFSAISFFFPPGTKSPPHKTIKLVLRRHTVSQYSFGVFHYSGRHSFIVLTFIKSLIQLLKDEGKKKTLLINSFRMYNSVSQLQRFHQMTQSD